jgi:light-regulated signal transduction histidine kinase (bacteriophytochrome)
MSKRQFEASDEVFHGEIPSRLDARESMIAQVMGRLTDSGLLLDEYFDRLCLDEGISNAIVHGNHGDPEKKVKVRAFTRGDHWEVEIWDEGAGFDWRALLEIIKNGGDPTSPSGRGIALILGSGAHVEFHDGGRRLLISRDGPGTSATGFPRTLESG